MKFRRPKVKKDREATQEELECIKDTEEKTFWEKKN